MKETKQKHQATDAERRHAKKEDSYSLPEKEAAQRSITRLDDPLIYTQLLNKSYAVMPDSAPALDSLTFEQRFTVFFPGGLLLNTFVELLIVDRVLELQFRQGPKPLMFSAAVSERHVYSSHTSRLRPSLVGWSGKRAPVGLECVSANAAVEMVNFESWNRSVTRKSSKEGCKKNYIGRTKDLIPIATPGTMTGKTVVLWMLWKRHHAADREGAWYIQFVDQLRKFLKSKSTLILPQSSRTKKVRPPSWKRRKMRQPGIDALHGNASF
ncbi:hypothetical protein R1sor_023204 [Riccia sorocarpa]|uniref:Uncharacterized protein n=1 Tax=Riccia sorocarpa TaxID=122646 RepID=A0ABD3GM27_9MARC